MLLPLMKSPQVVSKAVISQQRLHQIEEVEEDSEVEDSEGSLELHSLFYDDLVVDSGERESVHTSSPIWTSVQSSFRMNLDSQFLSTSSDDMED